MLGERIPGMCTQPLYTEYNDQCHPWQIRHLLMGYIHTVFQLYRTVEYIYLVLLLSRRILDYKLCT